MKKHTIIFFFLTFFLFKSLTAEVLLPSEKKALEKLEKQRYEDYLQIRQSQPAPPYDKEIQVVQPECLDWVGEGMGGMSNHQLQFYNQCPFSVQANICVEESPGKFRLHRSAARVPHYGRITIYTYERGNPGSVTWLSSRGSPGIPAQCR